MEITIDGKSIGWNHSPYIIAELSANHNGSLQKAFDSIKIAKQCGADAVKLQTYTADSMTINCENEYFRVTGGLWDGYYLYKLYEEAHTPYDWHNLLFDFARSIGITIFSTPFDEEGVDLLESLNCPAYKIASFEITDIPLLKHVARTRKPIIMSTGMANDAEIDEAVKTLKSNNNEDLILLHCISNYPTPVECSQLKQINRLATKHNVIAGLSDHTLDNIASITAVGVGAKVIEKHFTLNRQDRGPDSAFSIEPHELKNLCKDVRLAHLAIGGDSIVRDPDELKSRQYRRSLFFVNDLKANDTISKNDIRRIRPGYGIEPKYYDQIVGKKVRHDVCRGTPVSWDSILYP